MEIDEIETTSDACSMHPHSAGINVSGPKQVADRLRGEGVVAAPREIEHLAGLGGTPQLLLRLTRT
ncbi:hypothetical protein GCM10010178_76280 [Lentzea flava]|uniref:Uncharacterized protein n=1 Tax=Lentzea flava TaxID=103732 RepID=A0ABQ2VBU0_9PSEU|nr:hypothetical protein GCM10010178_76280 [Lentzea flava]